MNIRKHKGPPFARRLDGARRDAMIGWRQARVTTEEERQASQTISALAYAYPPSGNFVPAYISQCSILSADRLFLIGTDNGRTDEN